jgi:hypothetical protein
MKVQRFDTNSDGICEFCVPLEGIVVVTSPLPGLQVKTLDHSFSAATTLSVVYPIGGVVVDLRLAFFHRRISSDPISKPFGAGVGWSRRPYIFHT